MTTNPKMPCRDIAELCPTVRRGVEEFLKRCKAANLNVLVTQTYRSAEYQASLYAQGRTKPGSIVTNLTGKKGSESPHQFRIAFDICKNIKGQEYSDTSFFKACGKIWTEMGGVWGGNFKSFADTPHFEFTDNKGYAPFRNGFNFSDSFKMPWENTKPAIKEDDEVVEKVTMSIMGKLQPVNRILKDGRNYVELNTLKELGVINVGYDVNAKLVSVDKK